MEPITIRYLGLISLRKRTYLILQSIALAICFIALVWTLTLPDHPNFGLDRNKLPPIQLWILDHLWLIALVATVAEILDAIFSLRAFARKEEVERRRRSEDRPFPPSATDKQIKPADDLAGQRM
jgi:hypothetical protein